MPSTRIRLWLAAAAVVPIAVVLAIAASTGSADDASLVVVAPVAHRVAVTTSLPVVAAVTAAPAPATPVAPEPTTTSTEAPPVPTTAAPEPPTSVPACADPAGIWPPADQLGYEDAWVVTSDYAQTVLGWDLAVTIVVPGDLWSYVVERGDPATESVTVAVVQDCAGGFRAVTS